MPVIQKFVFAPPVRSASSIRTRKRHTVARHRHKKSEATQKQPVAVVTVFSRAPSRATIVAEIWCSRVRLSVFQKLCRCEGVWGSTGLGGPFARGPVLRALLRALVSEHARSERTWGRFECWELRRAPDVRALRRWPGRRDTLAKNVRVPCGRGGMNDGDERRSPWKRTSPARGCAGPGSSSKGST